MNTDKLKQIALEIKDYLEKEISKTADQIEKLTKTKDINLDNFPNARCLYQKEHNSKLSSIIPPSKKTLKRFIYKIELEKLYTKLEQLKESLKEIENNIKSLTNNELLKKNKALLQYYLTNTKDKIDEITKTIIAICSNTEKDQNDVLNRISLNIAESYDDKYELKKDKDFNTTKWLFEKMYITLFNGENEPNLITSIIDELNKQHKITNPDEPTSIELKENRDILKKIGRYVQNGRVVKPTNNIEEFAYMIGKTNFSEETKKRLVSEMRSMIEKEQNTSESKRLIRKYLSNQEQNLLSRALELYESHPEQKLYSMIQKEISHIISICRYIDLDENLLSHQSLFEDITSHIDNIRIIINSIKYQGELKPSYMYVTIGNVPLILNSIKLIDIIHYTEIYNFLNNLEEHSETSKHEYNIGDISINSFSSDTFKLFYTKLDNEYVLIDIGYLNTTNRPNISDKELISSLNKIKDKKSNPKFRKLAETYERMIVQCLNLDRTIHKRLLKRQER